MCGIAGAFGPGAEGAARRMSRMVAHRGPDDEGFALLAAPGGGVAGALAHRRLAIIDTSAAGHQPMGTPEGRYLLVFNGEIYNYRALRAELEAEGERFSSGSDTEVLLRGWARHGRRFLARLRGMFAFCIWDGERGVATLVRDSFGIKPLYYAHAGAVLVFASEVRAVLASGVVERVLSPEGVRSFLATGAVAEPLTIVEGVRALPPGTTLEVRVAGGVALAGAPERYEPPVASGAGDVLPAGEAAAAVRAALRDSVAHHMVADVPVGFFLSGGIDSSAVVALAAEVAHGRPETFTVTFGERAFSEAGPALAVAERFGTRHHEIPLTGADLLAALPQAFAAMDQPSIDGLNTYVVSRAVRERGLKVVLSGLGGDELFAGYPSFARAAVAARMHRVPAPIRRLARRAAGRAGGVRGEKLGLLLDGGSPAAAAYRASRALFGGRDVRALAGAGAVPAPGAPPAGLSLLQQVTWYELNGYMREMLLHDSDVFSMAHALELRVPFVDREVAAVAMRVPDAAKLRRGTSKPVLLDAVRDLLPREVWDRPKQGFTLPFQLWMRGELRGEVDRMLAPAGLAGVGVSPARAREVWSAYVAGKRMGWARPWALYTLVRWARENGMETGARAVPEAA